MRWITRGLLAAALALGVVVPTTAPGASAATELIKNGTFASGTTNWWGSGNTPISVDAGQLKAVVPGGTAQKWDAMLGQKVPAFPIHKDHRYVLSFDARASAVREVRTTVQLNDVPYTANLDKLFTVGTTTKRYAFAFTAANEITASELTFQLGGVAGYTLWLDNVSLVDNFGNVAGNPVSMTSGFYVDPDNNARIWKDKPENLNHPDRQLIIDNIATKPGARWFGGWSGDIADAVHRFVRDADAADKLPTLVAYNIPGRDACGGHSSGGAAGEAAYKAWIETFAAAIGNRPALVILEPDSIGDIQCIDVQLEKDARIRMLSFALQAFKDLAPNTWTYADATNKGWGEYITLEQVADSLTKIGVQNAHGLAVNVSNYYDTPQSITYANALNGHLSSAKPFVIDTSRNGKGSLNGEWCNPADRKLGVTSQVGGGAEMLLWIKVPGDSDGLCGIKRVDAGTFDPDLAKSLILGDSTP
ncbi:MULTISPECIES: glycoside hydrolase family 6 protein [unclassified Kribbella]|uniref:glycoside hydrolase family 6 protein n=1 Tax=unclassified Kribbella TaxID=2644121 RepID=UPI0030773E2E